MRQISFISCLTTLALLVGGCTIGGGGENTASSPSTPTSSPATTQSPTSKPFDGKPLVEGAQKPKDTPNPTQDKPSVAALTPPELITPTDPDIRRREVQKNINTQGAKDPFSLLPIPANPEAATANAPGTSAPLQPRAIPQQTGVPVPQPPKLTVTDARTDRSTDARTDRSIPSASTVPVVQPPRLRFPFATNRNLPQSQIAPGSASRRSNFRSPRRVPSDPPFTGGLGRAPQRPAVGTNAIAQVPRRTQPASRNAVRQPQRTIQTSRLVAQQAQRPASTSTRTTRTTRTTPRTTVARVVRRPQTVAVARSTPIPRRPSSVTIAQATPANSTPPAVNTPAVTPTLSVPAAPPQIPSLPAPPDPALARAVRVSGVIVVGNEPQAIVQAPNEATSRYVRAGQRLSNGQVLVKRIEMGEGSEPIVILEQNGVEVSKGVGETAPAPAQPGQTAPNQQPGTPQATV